MKIIMQKTKKINYKNFHDLPGDQIRINIVEQNKNLIRLN
jgi:hypothetical protein